MRRLVLVLGLLGIFSALVFAQTFGSIQVSSKIRAARLFQTRRLRSPTPRPTWRARRPRTPTGLYSFPDLVPGNYNVKVVATGFEHR